MNSIRPIEDQIRELEVKLLDPQIRKCRQYLLDLLADDFLEIGSSGHTYCKSDLIQALNEEVPGTMSMSEFQVKLISPDMALATYRILKKSEGSANARDFLHSSIWRFNEDKWQIAFHQGTPLP